MKMILKNSDPSFVISSCPLIPTSDKILEKSVLLLFSQIALILTCLHSFICGIKPNCNFLFSHAFSVVHFIFEVQSNNVHYNNLPRDLTFVTIVDKWSLFRGSYNYNCITKIDIGTTK